MDPSSLSSVLRNLYKVRLPLVITEARSTYFTHVQLPSARSHKFHAISGFQVTPDEDQNRHCNSHDPCNNFYVLCFDSPLEQIHSCCLCFIVVTDQNVNEEQC